jgi:hypothetical protein
MPQAEEFDAVTLIDSFVRMTEISIEDGRRAEVSNGGGPVASFGLLAACRGPNVNRRAYSLRLPRKVTTCPRKAAANR